jgi:hypothetical protein
MTNIIKTGLTIFKQKIPKHLKNYSLYETHFISKRLMAIYIYFPW